MPQLSYRQVSDLYRSLKNAGVVSTDLPTWSGEMNRLSQSDLYGAGAKDNWIKQASTSLDRLLEATGLPKATGVFGAGVGELVGAPEVGRSIGEGLPRMGIGLLGGLAGAAVGGPPGAAVGLGAAFGALGGAEAYTATGSPAVGLVAGGVNALMPSVMQAAEKAIFLKLGGKLLSGPISDSLGKITSTISPSYPVWRSTAPGQKAGAFFGAEGVGAVVGEVGSVAQAGVDPNAEYEFSPAAIALNATLGQLPFTAAHLAGKVLGKSGPTMSPEMLEKLLETSRQKIEEKAMREDAAQQSPIEKQPDQSQILDATQAEKLELRRKTRMKEFDPIRTESISDELEALNAEMAELTDATPDFVVKKDRLVQQKLDLIRVSAEAGGAGVMGEIVTAKSKRILVAGTEHYRNEKTGYRQVLVSDDPANIQNGFTPGQIIGYPTGGEPAPRRIDMRPGHFGWSIPAKAHDATIKDNYAIAKAAADAEQLKLHPELPLQSNDEGLLRVREQAADYSDVFALLEATDPDDLEGLRQVREAYNLVEKKWGVTRWDKKTETAVFGISDSMFGELATYAGHKLPTETLRAEIGKSTARMKLREDIILRKAAEQKTNAEAVQELLKARIVEGISSEKQVALANEINAVKEGLKLDEGQFNKLVLEWDKKRNKEGPVDKQVEQLVDMLRLAKQSGRGKQKVEPIVTRSEEAAKIESPETDHNQLVREIVARETASDMLDPVDVDEFVRDYMGGRVLTKLDDPALREAYVRTNEELARLGVHEDAGMPAMARAGGDFLWDFTGWDPVRQSINGKPLASLGRKDGNVMVSRFKNVAGEPTLSNAILEMGRRVVPEAFSTIDGAEHVNVPKLMSGLDENVVSNVTYGMEGKVSKERQALHAMTHEWLETFPGDLQNFIARQEHLTEPLTGSNLLQWITRGNSAKIMDVIVRDVGSDNTYQDFADKINKFKSLKKQVASEPPDTSPRATSYYKQISPFDTEKYPVVRVDVVLPRRTGKDRDAFGNLWKEDDLHESLPNTLGWAMVQFVPHPKTGETVMFVGEQQSRWGQSQQKKAEAVKKQKGTHFEAAGKASFDETNHPLLPLQHILVLKAAIAEAAKHGVTKIVMSDGETAMMTEGHDKQVSWDARQREINGIETLVGQGGLTRIEADEKIKVLQNAEPPQSAGMRLHYDTTLPSAMRSLTGVEGERVELGVHKNVAGYENVNQSQEFQQLRDSWNRKEITDDEYRQRVQELKQRFDPPGSLVFRNPDGKPKSSVTGLSFDISKAIAKMESLGGFTLSDPRRSPGDRTGVSRPFVPQNDFEREAVAALALDSKGSALIAQMKRDAVATADAAFVRDLETRFPAALERIFPVLMEQSHDGLAQYIGDRQVVIKFSSALMIYGDRQRRFDVVAHEVLHGLSLAELDSPTNTGYRNALESLRGRLIATLKPEVREHLAALEKSNWIERYAYGKAGMEELWGKKKFESDGSWNFGNEFKSISDILYGLTNLHELVSQGFSSKQMQDFMRSVKSELGPIRENAFVRFIKFIKTHLGLQVDDTEFARFVEISSNILRQGEWVSDISNFTDSWFAGKGLEPQAVREQSSRALALIQGTWPKPDSAAMINDLARTFGYTTTPYLRKFEGMVRERGADFEEASALFDDLGVPIESAKGALLAGHLDEGLPNMELVLELMPKSVSDLLFAQAHDMREVLDGVRAATARPNEGLLNLAPTETGKIHSEVTKALGALDDFLRLQEKEEEFRRELAGIVAPPDAFFQSVLAQSGPGLAAALQVTKRKKTASGETTITSDSKTMEDFEGEVVSELDPNLKVDWLQRNLTPPAQISMSNPVLAELYSKMILVPGKIRKTIDSVMAPFFRGLNADGTLGEMGAKNVLKSHFKKIKASPAYIKAANEFFWVKQKRGGAAVKHIPFDDPEVKPIFDRLNPEQRKDLIEFDNMMRLSKTQADRHELDMLIMDMNSKSARIPMAEEGMKYLPAVDAATKMFDALSADFSRSQDAQRANLIIQSIQQKFTKPDAFIAFYDRVKADVEMHNIRRDYLNENPDWISAKLNGAFKFEMWKGGKMTRGSAKNKSAAMHHYGIREDQILNWTKNDRGEAVDWSDMDEVQIRRMRELQDNQIQSMRNFGTPEEDIQHAMKLSPTLQVEREVNAQGVPVNLNLPGRTLSRVNEETPWAQNHFDWVERNVTYWEKRLLKTQADSLRLEPGTRDTETAALMKEHVENYLSADPKLAQGMQSFVNVWTLGFGMATSALNATQTILRGIPELVSLGHGWISGTNEMRQVWSDLIGRRLNDQPFRSIDEERFAKRALTDGQLSQSITDDQQKAIEYATVGFREAFEGTPPKTFGQYVESAAGAYSTTAMWMFRNGEYANNFAMLMAAFRTLTKLHPEMNFEDKVKQAYLVNGAVNDVGGRANRAVGLFSNRTPFGRTASMMATSLQSYLLGSTTQLIRHLKAGLGRVEGLTPAQIHNARKAAILQLAVQFSAAGVLGMPFVSGALALLNQAFPELELNRKIREGFSSLFGDDSENGHIISDMALSGIPSMMGWDMQSRLAAGNLLPGVSEYNGFQPEQLLGVPATMLTRFVQGGKKVAAGDPSGGYAFVPNAFRKLTELLAEDGQAKDYRGRPILDPTPGEALGLAIGFQPTRLTEHNVADRLARQSKHLAIVRRGQETQQMAEQVLKGNFGTVRTALHQQLAVDKNYNQANAVRAIALSAEEMTFPKDLRREGSRVDMDSRKKLLSSFSLDPSAISEVARFQFRQQIEQRLGLMSRDSTALTKAQLMDALRVQDPKATRAELSAAASAALRRSPPQALVDVPE